MKRLCVFLGSSPGFDPVYAEAATALGGLIASRGIGLVYGGGRVGLMGLLADAAMAAGGEVIGVIPEALDRREVAHHGCTELHITRSMHERKALMADLSDGFIALPGGIGTFEELFEIWTWGQLGDHAKPVGLIDVAGFYAPLIAFIDGVVARGFLKPEHRAMLMVETDGPALIDRMTHYHAPALGKWIGDEER